MVARRQRLDMVTNVSHSWRMSTNANANGDVMATYDNVGGDSEPTWRAGDNDQPASCSSLDDAN